MQRRATYADAPAFENLLDTSAALRMPFLNRSGSGASTAATVCRVISSCAQVRRGSCRGCSKATKTDASSSESPRSAGVEAKESKRRARGGLKGAEALCGLARIPSDCEHDETQPAAAGTRRSRRPLMVAQREPARDGLGGSAVSSAAYGSDSSGLGDSDSDIGCCRKRLR